MHTILGDGVFSSPKPRGLEARRRQKGGQSPGKGVRV